MPRYMYANTGEEKLLPVTTAYNTTRMPASASGFTIEYNANKSGLVQLDSICQPSHAAVLNERHRVLSTAFGKLPLGGSHFFHVL